MDILKLMESTEEEVQDYMKEKKIPTLEALVEEYHKAVEAAKEKGNMSRGKVPRITEQWKNKKAYGHRFRKAHGGYVKKYAKGGGVRKVRR